MANQEFTADELETMMKAVAAALVTARMDGKIDEFQKLRALQQKVTKVHFVAKNKGV